MFLESINKFAPITFGTVEGFLIGAATGSNVEGPFIGALLGLLTSSVVRISFKLFFHGKKPKRASFTTIEKLSSSRSDDDHIIIRVGGSRPNPSPGGPSARGHSMIDDE